MEFPSVQIQGSVVSSEILGRISTEDEKYQAPSYFSIKGRSSVRDEIGLAWVDARQFWATFATKRERLREDELGVSETRNFWLIPLLNVLGYDVVKATAIVDADSGKTYAISHRDEGRNGFPIHLVGIGESLDARREHGGTRLSAHALAQEYLNHTEHTYAIVSNGALLRLLRDNSRLVRMSYLEFNLEKMMTEELYGDFALLYRLLHATRMPMRPDALEESYIEHYHLESLGSGARIRERLSVAVEESIKLLGNAFLKPLSNKRLRDAIDCGEITPNAYYLQLLRLIYRLLFLIVIEERQLIYADAPSPEVQEWREIYQKHYSLGRLRKLAGLRRYIDGRKHDLWQGLMATFRLFENEQYGLRLGIKPLGTGLWAEELLDPLPELLLSNGVLLEVLHKLSFFEDAQRQLVRVNYSDLDVEEFGSVYEGLLEYAPVFNGVNGSLEFSFKEGSARSSSGSHYTPEELVKPLITHSLDHLIADKLKDPDPEAALLSLRVADIACGSGHILLSAARRIGFKLACVRETRDSRAKYLVEQPSPSYMRAAVRDAISHCIYGVDKNPFAVELCKVALWLEAHKAGEPLGFLDHHIKCGDAIVGLAHAEDLDRGIATEAFTTLNGDEKEVAAGLRQVNKRERGTRGQQVLNFEGWQQGDLPDMQAAYRVVEAMPEKTPGEIVAKEAAYRALASGPGFQHLKRMADLQVAQFFIPKTVAQRGSLVTDARYFRLLRRQAMVSDGLVAELDSQVSKWRFFHWFLEFPEVFLRGGFDCILGNPPFLGGTKISTYFGDSYLLATKNLYTSMKGGNTDLVAYFFRRSFNFIKKAGFLSMISTKTIAQTDTRRDGLDVIVQEGSINHAVRSMRWPGKANVNVSLVTVYRGKWTGEYYLDRNLTGEINSLLKAGLHTQTPLELRSNHGNNFRGPKILGTGFAMSITQAQEILKTYPLYRVALFPYYSGEDVNRHPLSLNGRWVINFFGWEEQYCRLQFPLLMDKVEREVRPSREVLKMKSRRNFWWRYGDSADDMYKALGRSKAVLVSAITTKHLSFCRVSLDADGVVFSHSLSVFTTPDFCDFIILQSTIHNEWAWEFGPTMKADLAYSIRDCFKNFPLPRLASILKLQLNTLGEAYHNHRAQLMQSMQLGLTKTYNLFHSKPLRAATEEELALNDKPFEKLLGKDALALRKHLAKTPDTISFNNVVVGIMELRRLHVEMDQAVAAAYNWADINLGHDFQEMDYLPEHDRVRYTISPEARREVLTRLLALNHARHAEEVRAGLWKGKGKRKA